MVLKAIVLGAKRKLSLEVHIGTGVPEVYVIFGEALEMGKDNSFVIALVDCSILPLIPVGEVDLLVTPNHLRISLHEIVHSSEGHICPIHNAKF